MWIGLGGKKTFTGIIHVQVMDILPYQPAELLTVRGKGNTTMNIQLQGWPDIRQTGLTRDLEDTADQYQGPGGHPGNGSDIFGDGVTGQSFDLVLPFIQKSDAQFGRPDPMPPERRVL